MSERHQSFCASLRVGPTSHGPCDCAVSEGEGVIDGQA